ncbi:MAG: histidine--tRNA ligase [Candidatus Magasanikbacteria bacterium]|nr:histidine--tRNA ligase [Candidatus Magasanikbacteria bacterium]
MKNTKQNKKPAKFVKREIKKEANEPLPEGAALNKSLPAGKGGKKIYQALRGMHDVLPKDEKYWAALYHTAEKLASYYQFARVETPILEEASLFIRSVGKGTDIVDKEMYIFEDRDGTRVALRPEPTAGIVRSYIQHGLWNAPQPVKVWTSGPIFRHDRPQAGRYRQFYQFDFETIGAKDPAMDVELILVAYSIFKDLGISTEVRINSIGDREERARYVAELTNYYRGKRAYLCDDCKNRLSKNPLRLLDCKVEGCQPIKETAPQIIDWLGESSKNYFMKVLEYLDELSIPYLLDHTLVRGLDYYTHTVFEIYESAREADPSAASLTGAQSALAGGGRYDLLAEELGGQSAPAVGFGLGIERAVTVLKALEEKKPGSIPGVVYDVFFAQLGEEAKRRSLKILNELRFSGIRPAFNLFRGSLKAQLETANSLKVPYVLILGQKEVQDKTIIIRDMESGVQEIVDQKKLEAAIKKKLIDRLPK